VQRHRTAPLDYESIPDYDAVLITQKYPDHLHEITLRRLNPKRVLAPEPTVKRLRRLLPERELVGLGTSLPHTSVDGVRFDWLPTRRRIDPIYDAVLLDSGAESVLVATHGLELDEGHERVFERASPVRLVISPFNHYRLPTVLGGVVTPGLPGLHRLVERLKPSWVARTHDEDKHARGLVPRLAQITRFDQSSISNHPWLESRYLALEGYEEVAL